MQIPKEQILAMIRERGGQGQESEANGQLPDQVDPQRDSGLLEKFGLSPQDLLSKFGGGGLGGGGLPKL